MRTTIHTMQNNFKLDAEQLGNYEAMSKTELANGYCDADEAGDEVMKSAYFSALMLRYWYKIWAWQKESASLHLAPTDFVDWLVDSLIIAFTYRTWRYEYKPKVSLKNNGAFEGWELDENGNKIPNPYYYKVDPDAPDKIINRCCFSTRGREYQYHNKDKRSANVNTTSLDSLIDENVPVLKKPASGKDPYNRYILCNPKLSQKAIVSKIKNNISNIILFTYKKCGANCPAVIKVYN